MIFKKMCVLALVFAGPAALADPAASGGDPGNGYTVWLASKSTPQRICNSSAIRGKRLARIRSGTRGCGVTSPVRVHEVSGVALSPPAIMDCRTARSLRKWVRRGPKRTLGALGGGLVEMRVYDHYNCRTRNNVRGAKLSVHSGGRAIDIGSFHLADGRSISVLEHWADPRYGKHLRKMLRRACGTFTTVLGPNYNAAHRNHFHLDKETRRYGAYCR